jgi:hypothetical protein
MPGLTADYMAMAKYAPGRISFGTSNFFLHFSNPNKLLALAKQSLPAQNRTMASV